MNRTYRYNPNVSNEPNEERYLQLISSKDLYIQNMTLSKHDNHNS